ncbi:MAG: hypothetical protein Ta2D_01450 [Rickettsiales bacterium]|nr:MAG: hypothetical protein Ta2D_01450 [Rickettsiales bacterium]
MSDYIIGGGATYIGEKPKALVDNEENIPVIATQPITSALDSERIEKLKEFGAMGYLDKKSFKDIEKYLEHKEKFEEKWEKHISALKEKYEELKKIDTVLKKNRKEYENQLKNTKDSHLIALLDTEYEEIIEYAYKQYGRKRGGKKNITTDDKQRLLFFWDDSEINLTTRKYERLTDIRPDSDFPNRNLQKIDEDRKKLNNELNKICDKITNKIGGSSFYLSESDNFFTSKYAYINGKKPFNDKALFVFDEKKPKGYCFSKEGKIYSFELDKKLKPGEDNSYQYRYGNLKYVLDRTDLRKIIFKNIQEIDSSQLPEALQNNKNLEAAASLKYGNIMQDEGYDSKVGDDYRVNLLNEHLKARESKNMVIADQTTRKAQKALKEEDFIEIKELLAKDGTKIIEKPIIDTSESIQKIQELKNNPKFTQILNDKKALASTLTLNTPR